MGRLYEQMPRPEKRQAGKVAFDDEEQLKFKKVNSSVTLKQFQAGQFFWYTIAILCLIGGLTGLFLYLWSLI